MDIYHESQIDPLPPVVALPPEIVTALDEYREFRKALRCLRLEAPASVMDDVDARFDALLAAITRALSDATAAKSTTDPEIWKLLEAAYDEVKAGSRGRFPAQVALERALATLMQDREQAADNFPFGDH